MGAFQEFEFNNIKIRFFKDFATLFLMPGKGSRAEKLSLLKNQLESMLSVESIKTQDNGISIKISNDSSTNVPELLRAMGASGGEEIEDAGSIAQEPAEKEAEETQEQQPQVSQIPPHQQDMGGMGGGMPPEQEQGGMPLMAHYYPKMFIMLYESSPFAPKKKRMGRRVGEYWESLERASGKKRQRLNIKDVFNLRRKYARKPESEKRNTTLRDIDKAFGYFVGKAKEFQGPGAAEKLTEEYYSIDELTPSDYSEDRGKPEPLDMMDGGMSMDPEGYNLDDDSSINSPDFGDFDELEDEDEESYDDIEIEEETF